MFSEGPKSKLCFPGWVCPLAHACYTCINASVTSDFDHPKCAEPAVLSLMWIFRSYHGHIGHSPITTWSLKFCGHGPALLRSYMYFMNFKHMDYDPDHYIFFYGPDVCVCRQTSLWLTITSLSLVAASKALSLQGGLRHSEFINKVVIESQPLTRGSINNFILWNGRCWHCLDAAGGYEFNTGRESGGREGREGGKEGRRGGGGKNKRNQTYRFSLIKE